MHHGDGYLEKPDLEQRAEPASLEAKLDQTDAPAVNRFDFVDKQGRTIDVQTWKSGDSVFVRGYDRASGQPPEQLSIGQAGYANAALERNPHTGQVDRMRLQDVHTTADYRKSGLGSRMLEQMEAEGRKQGVREIHGTLSYEWQDETAVRRFYRTHGYDFRPRPGGAEEVFKRLA